MSTLWHAVKHAPVAGTVFLVRCYQVVISPHFPGCCRFTPTCSQYAIIALKRYGLLKGGWLAVKRIARCRPGGPYGYDPVP
ncbi:MAG TPA: membrane protein insertion efficiency factor YidD [Candidatus Aveggerthella excrementigallinarum]|nr:membrane protein insertion efficiency factor YidD [Candidatus Aveggerthella excrementigallinarum]